MKVTYKGMLPTDHGGPKVVVTFYLINRKPVEIKEGKEIDDRQDPANHSKEGKDP
jgi:hypothetical protein